MKKLVFSSVLADTFKVYRQHFIKLIIMSGILGLINILIKVISNITFDFQSPIVIILVGTFQVASIIFLFYSYLRGFCAMTNYTYNLVTDNEISYKDSIYYSKRLWTKLLGVGVLIIAMVFIPVTIIIFADILFSSLILSWSIKGLMIGLLTVIIVRYSFIIYLKLIEPDSKNYITRTVNLLKGNYLVYFLVLLVVYSLTFVNIIIDYQLIGNGITIIGEIFMSIIFNLVNIFVLPVVIVSQVIIYINVIKFWEAK